MTETRGRPVTDHSRSAQTRRENYAALRGAHLCAWSASCGQTAMIGSTLCASHRPIANAANASLYAYRKQHDLCRDCGQRVAGRSRCYVCSDKRKHYASRQPEYRRAKERKG